MIPNIFKEGAKMSYNCHTLVVAVTYTMRGTKISIRSVKAVQLGVFLQATGNG